MEVLDFELELTDITTDLSIEVENITPMIKEVEVIVPEYIEVDTKFKAFVQNQPFEVTAEDFGDLTEVIESKFAHSSIEKVTIPSTITSIGVSAFDNCTNLKTAILKDGLTSIGKYAFRQSGIESIEIPDSVTSMSTYVFTTCKSLKNAKVPFVPNSTFYNCTSLRSVKIGNSAEIIENSAFSNCTNLTSITIPSSVTSIGQSAFASCDKIPAIIIPDSVTSIGNSAFNLGNTNNRKCIIIPNSVTTITGTIMGNISSSTANNFIAYCEATEKPSGWSDSWINVNAINRTVWGIKDWGVTDDGLVWVSTDGDSAGIVGDYENNTVPEHLVIPEKIGNYTLKSINMYALKNCTVIKSITLPNTLETLDSEAFRGCTGLTSVVIPNTVKTIMSAFRDCTNITELTVGSGVINMGNYSLSIGSFSKKATVTMLPTTPPTLSASNAIGSYVEKIIVPKGCLSAYQTATNWSTHSSKMVEATE